VGRPFRSNGGSLDLSVAAGGGNEIDPQDAFLQRPVHEDQRVPESTTSGVTIGGADDGAQSTGGGSSRPSGYTDIWFFPSAERADDPGEVEVEQAENSRGTRLDDRGIGFVDHSAAVESTPNSAVLGSANEDTEGFGPLKVTLQAIPTVFANREFVRSRSPVKILR
jgi:hypothetical protein